MGRGGRWKRRWTRFNFGIGGWSGVLLQCARESMGLSLEA